MWGCLEGPTSNQRHGFNPLPPGTQPHLHERFALSSMGLSNGPWKGHSGVLGDMPAVFQALAVTVAYGHSRSTWQQMLMEENVGLLMDRILA